MPKSSLKKIKSQLEQKNQHFKNQVEDHLELDSVNLKICAFSNLGLKNVKIRSSSITQSKFNSVYARNSVITNVDFTGSTFEDCDFSKAQIENSIFRFCQFKNTKLPWKDVMECLPLEANLKEDVARNLKMNCLNQGLKIEADKFLKIELEAKAQRLKDIVTLKTEYHRSKYSNIDQLRALQGYLAHHTIYFMTGYGFNIRKILFSFILGILFITLINYTFFTGENIDFGKYLIATIFSIFNLTQEGIVHYTNGLGQIILQAFSIVYLGIIVATVYRKIGR